MKSFRPKDGGRSAGARRRAEPRRTSTDRREPTKRTPPRPIPRPGLAKGPGKEARLSYMGHVLMENRNGLVVDPRLTKASGNAERIAAVEMVSRAPIGRSRSPLASTRPTSRGLRQRTAVDERHAPRCSARTAALGDRRTHHAARRLRRQPAHSQTDRGDLRLDQDDRRPGADPIPRPRARWMGLHLRDGRLQPGADAEAPRRALA